MMDLAACGETVPPVHARLRQGLPGPVLVFAVDGLEWGVMEELARDGRLPTLHRLRAEGRSGLLETFRPTESPVIWTSVATGKGPAKHGILSFVFQDAAGQPALYTNADRRTKAVWNVLSDYAMRVGVIGWWMTYPVEPVNGVMVAQTNTALQIREGTWKGSIVPGAPAQVHPPELEQEVMRLVADVEENLPGRNRRVFGEVEPAEGSLEEELFRRATWGLRADAAYERVARRLVRTEEPFDLLMVYCGAADALSHLFWRYRHPELYAAPPGPEEIEAFGRLIDDYYVQVDASLGRLLEELGEGVTVFVLSDHGMRAANLAGAYPADGGTLEIRSAAHEEAPPGVLIAAGPAVRAERGGRRDGEAPEVVGSVLDVTPTLLHLFGLPVGRDMDGRVLTELLEDPWGSEPPAAVGTHDMPEFRDVRQGDVETPWEEERIEQLRGLGYIP
jgi:predicted AlkP superfamily phosphohydrolase/phosphomutase